MKMDAKNILKKVKECAKIIAAERDKLRNIIDEIKDVEQCSTGAIEDLDSAIDKLSEQL